MTILGSSVAAVAMLSFGLAIGSPAAATGFQAIVSFDDLALGTTSFDDDQFPDHISGGKVVAGTADYPAVSGNQVYGGTAIGGIVDDEIAFGWPAIGGFVTGPGTITLRTFGYDPDLAAEFAIGTFSVPGGQTNAFLSSGQSGQLVTRWEFASDRYFTLDDMALGLPDVPPGIPEPASWALMIVGFSMVGAASRRRWLRPD